MDNDLLHKNYKAYKNPEKSQELACAGIVKKHDKKRVGQQEHQHSLPAFPVNKRQILYAQNQIEQNGKIEHRNDS